MMQNFTDELLLKTNNNRSNVRIAEIVGMAESSVRKLRTELEAKGIIQSVDKRYATPVAPMHAGGKSLSVYALWWGKQTSGEK